MQIPNWNNNIKRFIHILPNPQDWFLREPRLDAASIRQAIVYHGIDILCFASLFAFLITITILTCQKLSLVFRSHARRKSIRRYDLHHYPVIPQAAFRVGKLYLASRQRHRRLPCNVISAVDTVTFPAHTHTHNTTHNFTSTNTHSNPPTVIRMGYQTTTTTKTTTPESAPSTLKLEWRHENSVRVQSSATNDDRRLFIDQVLFHVQWTKNKHVIIRSIPDHLYLQPSVIQPISLFNNPKTQQMKLNAPTSRSPVPASTEDSFPISLGRLPFEWDIHFFPNETNHTSLFYLQDPETEKFLACVAQNHRNRSNPRLVLQNSIPEKAEAFTMVPFFGCDYSHPAISTLHQTVISVSASSTCTAVSSDNMYIPDSVRKLLSRCATCNGTFKTAERASRFDSTNQAGKNSTDHTCTAATNATETRPLHLRQKLNNSTPDNEDIELAPGQERSSRRRELKKILAKVTPKRKPKVQKHPHSSHVAAQNELRPRFHYQFSAQLQNVKFKYFLGILPNEAKQLHGCNSSRNGFKTFLVNWDFLTGTLEIHGGRHRSIRINSQSISKIKSQQQQQQQHHQTGGINSMERFAVYEDGMGNIKIKGPQGWLCCNGSGGLDWKLQDECGDEGLYKICIEAPVGFSRDLASTRQIMVNVERQNSRRILDAYLTLRCDKKLFYSILTDYAALPTYVTDVSHVDIKDIVKDKDSTTITLRVIQTHSFLFLTLKSNMLSHATEVHPEFQLSIDMIESDILKEYHCSYRLTSEKTSGSASGSYPHKEELITLKYQIKLVPKIPTPGNVFDNLVKHAAEKYLGELADECEKRKEKVI